MRISAESIDDDFIKLQQVIKNNETVKHLNIFGEWYLGGSVLYNLLRSFNIMFPEITSLAFFLRQARELNSYLDAEVDSSSSAAIPLFRSVTRLNFGCDITADMLRTCLYPGNNIKYLEIRDAHLFGRLGMHIRPYLRHLTLLEEIHLNCYFFDDTELIDRFVKLLPTLRVFRIDYYHISPKVLKMILFTCSSNNCYGIQFIFNSKIR